MIDGIDLQTLHDKITEYEDKIAELDALEEKNTEN